MSLSIFPPRESQDEAGLWSNEPTGRGRGVEGHASDCVQPERERYRRDEAGLGSPSLGAGGLISRTPRAGIKPGRLRSVGSFLRDLAHGFALMVGVYVAFVGCLYGCEALSDWWSEFRVTAWMLGLWSASLTCWLAFSILGNARVIDREDK